MKLQTIAFLGLTLFSAKVLPHDFDHLKNEELRLLVLEQREVIVRKDKALAHKDNIIAHYASMVAYLEKELAQEMHKLNKWHEFKKVLENFFR